MLRTLERTLNALAQKLNLYGRKPLNGERRKTDFVEYYMRLWFTFCLAPAGLMLILAMIIPVPIAIFSLEMPSYQLFVAIFMLLFVTWLMSRWRRTTIRVTGGVPEKVSAGTPFYAALVLKNVGTRAVHDLSAGYFLIPTKRSDKPTRFWRHFFSRYAMDMYLPDKVKVLKGADLVQTLGAGESVSVSIEMTYVRRGIYELPSLLVFSEFPFNLFRAALRMSADSTCRKGVTVTVLPTFVPAEGIDIPPAKKYQPGGISLTSNIGESPEYIGSREYRYGDNVRRIDFRAWARTGSPVVREYQEEYYSRIALVMDTFVPKHVTMEKEGYPDLEGTIQLSAAIADSLSNGEYIIDLFAAGPDLYVFRAGRHTAHFDNILEVLACLDRCVDNPFDEIAPSLLNELGNISTAIFVFMDWDETRERMVRSALQSGCSVKIYIVRSETTTLPLEGAEHLVGNVQVFTPDEVSRGVYKIL